MTNGHDDYREFLMDRYGARRRELENTVDLLNDKVVDLSKQLDAKDALIAALTQELEHCCPGNCNNQGVHHDGNNDTAENDSDNIPGAA